MKDLSPEEAGRWMTAAPQIVQDAVASPDTQKVIDDIGRQYILHVDVIGLLFKLTSYMLLGYAKPEESLQELRSAGITDEQARKIISEINTKIFLPLREKMRTGTGVSAAVPKPAPHPAVATGVGGPRPAFTPRPLPPAATAPATGAENPPKFFHLENKLPPAPRATQSAATAMPSVAQPPRPPAPSAPIAPQPVRKILPSASAAPQVPQPQAMPKPVMPMQAQQARPMAVPAQQPRPMTIPPQQLVQPEPPAVLNTEQKPQLPTPTRQPAPAIAPLPPRRILPRSSGEPASKLADRSDLRGALAAVLPPASVPGSIVHPPLTPPRPVVIDKVQAVSQPIQLPIPPQVKPAPPKQITQAVPAAPTKPYSSDPYREPIE